MLSKLEGMIEDGRITNAQLLFNSIKGNLPIQVRVMAANAIDRKIAEIRTARMAKRENIVLDARARWKALFKEVK
jgi:hypothetical protein